MLKEIIRVVAEKENHHPKNLSITFDGEMFEVLDHDGDCVIGFDRIEEIEHKYGVILK